MECRPEADSPNQLNSRVLIDFDHHSSASPMAAAPYFLGGPSQLSPFYRSTWY